MKAGHLSAVCREKGHETFRCTYCGNTYIKATAYRYHGSYCSKRPKRAVVLGAAHPEVAAAAEPPLPAHKDVAEQQVVIEEDEPMQADEHPDAADTAAGADMDISSNDGDRSSYGGTGARDNDMEGHSQGVRHAFDDEAASDAMEDMLDGALQHDDATQAAAGHDEGPAYETHDTFAAWDARDMDPEFWDAQSFFSDTSLEDELEDVEDGDGGAAYQHAVCSCGCGRSNAARCGTVRWYQMHLDDPLFPSSASADAAAASTTYTTTRQAIATFVELYDRHGFSCKAADDMLCLLSVLLPQPNFMPRSLHLLRAVIAAPEWTDYEVHVCSHKKCVGHVFPNLKRSEWAQHKDDKCPHCAETRFIVNSQLGEGGIRKCRLSIPAEPEPLPMLVLHLA